MECSENDKCMVCSGGDGVCNLFFKFCFICVASVFKFGSIMFLCTSICVHIVFSIADYMVIYISGIRMCLKGNRLCININAIHLILLIHMEIKYDDNNQHPCHSHSFHCTTIVGHKCAIVCIKL